MADAAEGGALSKPRLRLLPPICALIAAAACGLGDKQESADAIVAATRATFEAGGARGTMDISMRIVEVPSGISMSIGGVQVGSDSRTPGTGRPTAGGDQAPVIDQPPVAGPSLIDEEGQSRSITMDVALDLARDRASVTPTGGDAPAVIHDGVEVFGRRFDAGPRDARPWIRVDLEDVEEGAKLSTADLPLIGGFALSPVTLLDLAAGPLTGSIERVGDEVVGGTPAVRYEANFDLEKMLRDTREKRWPEDRREALEALLDTLSAKGMTHPGQVWIDRDGFVRRFEIRLEEEPIKNVRFELILALELTSIGDSVTIDVPGAQERIDVDNVVQLLRSVIPPPGSPEFFSFIGIGIPPMGGETSQPGDGSAPGAPEPEAPAVDPEVAPATEVAP